MTLPNSLETNPCPNVGNLANCTGSPLKVKIGDQFQNTKGNRFTIVDYDRLCVQLRDDNRGKVTTLSRQLLKEWIEHIRKCGFKSGRTTRKEISPNSNIDPMEHGQESILPTIAIGVIEKGGDESYFEWSPQQDAQALPPLQSFQGANREKSSESITNANVGPYLSNNEEKVFLLRLAAALRTKPFAILAGHSGTGKSRMVRKLAYMTCKAGGGFKALLEKDGKELACPGNFCMVQVKPNWHDSTDLLGYYSELSGGFKGTDFVRFLCRAYAYPEVPFFVCLDEMNLAPVEQYFAEFLSAIESRRMVGSSMVTDRIIPDEAWRTKTGAQDFSGLGCETMEAKAWLEVHGLTIPQNLFVVGTVNMDETTNQFSRKVLDRAFTLEMTDVDFDNFGENNANPSFKDYIGDDFAKTLLNGGLQASDLTADHKLKKEQADNLNSLKSVLKNTAFVVAYRFANEYALYEDSLEKMMSQFTTTPPAASVATGEATSSETGETSSSSSQEAVKPNAFDDIVLMKLLPRINGEDRLVLKIFTGKEDGKLESAGKTNSLAGILGGKGASFEKMKEIVARGGTYLSFWP